MSQKFDRAWCSTPLSEISKNLANLGPSYGRKTKIGPKIAEIWRFTIPPDFGSTFLPQYWSYGNQKGRFFKSRRIPIDPCLLNHCLINWLGARAIFVFCALVYGIFRKRDFFQTFAVLTGQTCRRPPEPIYFLKVHTLSHAL